MAATTGWETWNNAEYSWPCSGIKPSSEQSPAQQRRAAMSPSWVTEGLMLSSRLSKFLTSEAEIETEVATDTAAKLINSEVLSLVSVPVTPSADTKITRDGFLSPHHKAPAYETEEKQRCLLFSPWLKGRGSMVGSQVRAVCHKQLSCNLLLVFHLKVPLRYFNVGVCGAVRMLSYFSTDISSAKACQLQERAKLSTGFVISPSPITNHIKEEYK